MKTCKCIILIIVLSVSTIVSAQFTSVEQPNSDLGSSMPSGMELGSSMSSTVYEVEAMSPSRKSLGSVNALNSAQYDDWGNLIEDGNQDEGSPIGAPWVMLVFAALAAGWVCLRHHRQQA